MLPEGIVEVEVSWRMKDYHQLQVGLRWQLASLQSKYCIGGRELWITLP